MWLIAPFAFVFCVAIVGSFIIAAAKMMGRLILAASLALLIGVVTVLALPHQDDGIAIGALLALALTAPIFWLLTPRRTKRLQRDAQSEPSAARVPEIRRQSWWSGTRRSGRAVAWTRLGELAPDHAARLLVAKRSCERFEAQCEKRPFDLEAHRSLVIIRKRVPDLITQELERAHQLAAPLQMRALEELVELVERVAADCERRLAGTRTFDANEDHLLRRHVENYLAGDALSALKP